MLRLLIDEDFDNDILRGMLHQHPDIDVIRVQDAELSSATDEAILAWAAAQSRVVVSHDVRTMISAAYARVELGLRMPGLIVSSQGAALGQVISDLLLLAMCSTENEWDGQVLYLPW
jgi:hypothetical protein